MDLRAVEHTLTWMIECPLGTCGRLVVIDGLLEHHADGQVHHFFYFAHPVFDLLVARVDRLHEFDTFPLSRPHGSDSCVRFKRHIIHVLEYLLKMGLHIPHFLSLGQDLQEIVVSQEVETSEYSALLLEVVLETTLDFLKVSIAISESLQKTDTFFKLSCAGLEHVGVLLSTLNDRNPSLVDSLELLRLGRQLLRDVI